MKRQRLGGKGVLKSLTLSAVLPFDSLSATMDLTLSDFMIASPSALAAFSTSRSWYCRVLKLVNVSNLRRSFGWRSSRPLTSETGLSLIDCDVTLQLYKCFSHRPVADKYVFTVPLDLCADFLIVRSDTASARDCHSNTLPPTSIKGKNNITRPPRIGSLMG